MLPDNQYEYRFNIKYIDSIKHKYLLIDWIVNSLIIILFIIIIFIAIKRKYIINEQIESNKNSKLNYKRKESRLKSIERFTMTRVKQSIRCLNKRRIERSNSDSKITLMQAEFYAANILEKDSFIKDLYTQPVHVILNKFSKIQKYQELKSSNVEKLKILHHCYSNNLVNKAVFNDKSNLIFDNNNIVKAVSESVEENEAIETFPISYTNKYTNDERIETITLDYISLNSNYKENTPNADANIDKNEFISYDTNQKQESVTISNSNVERLEETLNNDSIREFDNIEIEGIKKAFKNFKSIPHPGDKLLDQSVNCTIQD